MEDLSIKYLFKQNYELRIKKAQLKEELKKTKIALSSANMKIKKLETTIELMKRDQESIIESAIKKAIVEVTKELNKNVKKK